VTPAHLPTHASQLISFHVDAGAEAAFASIDVAILVALLVVASVLQLSNPQNGDKFSLAASEAWGHSTVVLRLVELLTYLSAVAGCLSLVAMTLQVTFIAVTTLALSALSIVLFAAVCALSIRWFWKSDTPER
jgi:hypothetical protein